MDSQKEVEDDAAELKATLDRIKQDQALHKARQVELKGVPVPEGMKINGPTISLSTMPKFYDKVTSYPPPERYRKKESIDDWDDPDDPRNPHTKVVVATKGKLDRFRKEAKAMGHFQKSAGRRGIWSPKDTRLRPATPNSTITAAPRSLIDEHRKAASPAVIDPSVKPATIFAPKRKRVEHNETPQPGVMTNEERENRLRAFTNPSSAGKSKPNQEASTPPAPSSATSPSRKTMISSSTASELAKLPVPKVQASPNPSSPLKRKDRVSPTPGPRIPRADTSSPSNGGVRPTMPLKKKAPVDCFMPAKRRKIS